MNDCALNTLQPKQADNGLWGYVDSNGVFVIDPIFSYAYDFKDGYAEIRDEQGERGIVNTLGQWMSYPEPKSIMDIDPEVPEYETYLRNLRYEYREQTIKCKYPILSEKWSSYRDPKEGLAAVKDPNGKWGFANLSGDLICPCQWEAVGDFNEGLSWVADDDYKCGLINTKGQIVVKPRFHTIYCKDGLLHIAKDETHWGLAYKDGNIITQCLWKEDIQYIDLATTLKVKDQNDLYGLMDMGGNIISPCQWKGMRYEGDGLIGVLDQKDRVGVIDIKGNIINPCQ